MIWDWQFALQSLPALLEGLLTTIAAVGGGMVIALSTGLLWALLRRSRWWILAGPTGFVVEFVRSTPLLVQLYFLFYVLPDFGLMLPAFATGVTALGIHYSCYISEVYRAGIDAVPRGQWEAAASLGFGGWRTYRHIILPQAIPRVLPALGNYLIAMFKDTPLLSAITVVEVLQRAKIMGKESFRYLEPLTLVGLLYLVLSLLSGLLVRRLERSANVSLRT